MKKDRCAQLWEKLYPDVKRPDTYFREWVDAALPSDVKGVRALDAGSGTGGTVDYAAKGEGVFSVGVDISHEALKRNAKVNAKVVCSLDELPFADGVFDVVSSEFVVEHLEKPQKSLNEISRVSAPDARFVFLTTNSSGYIGLLIRLMPQFLQRMIKLRVLGMREEEVMPVHLRLNTEVKIRRGLGMAGFDPPEFFFVGGPFYFSFSYMLFRIAVMLERLTDGRLRRLKFYIIARTRKHS